MLLTRSSDLSGKRRGKVVFLVAVCLTVLMGVVGIAVDGGMLLNERRHAQATADAVALAAANDLFKHYGTNAGSDVNNSALNTALTTAAANGYTNDQTNSIVTINLPQQNYQDGP